MPPVNHITRNSSFCSMCCKAQISHPSVSVKEFNLLNNQNIFQVAEGPGRSVITFFIIIIISNTVADEEMKRKG